MQVCQEIGVKGAVIDIFYKKKGENWQIFRTFARGNACEVRRRLSN